MRWLRRVIGGAVALVRRGRVERDLDEELRAYLDASVAENMRAGAEREHAVRAARAALGSVEAVKDHTRDVGWETVVESVWRDVRYAARTLRRSRGFTFVAVLTLALGIGATTAIVSLLDAIIFKSLPVRNPEELVLVDGSPHYPVFQAFQQHTDVFVNLLATSGITTLDVEVQNGIRERTDVSLVSGSYFSTLGVQAAMGRIFTIDDDRTPGAHPVAVISEGYWQRRFGRNAAVVGQVIRIGDASITIVGVSPPGFFGEHVGLSPDLWVPLTMWGHVVPGRNLLQSPGTGWVRMIGRVQPGVAISGPHPGLTETFRQVAAEIFGPKMPEDIRRDIANASIGLKPAGTGLSGLRTQFGPPLLLLMAAVVVVLLIACANIANLLIARSTARRREIDVRVALGLSRARLVRQLLTESLVLALLGGAAGVAVASLAREGLLRLISADGSRVPLEVATDGRLVAFVALISSGTAILFGLAPALRSARAGIVTSLVARHETRPHSIRLAAVLVIAQVALSLVLLMGAGLFLRTIANLRGVDLGFVPERLLIVEMHPQTAGYSGERAAAFARRLLDEIAAVPGVLSASLSEHGVLTGTDNSTDLMRAEGFIAGPEGFPRTRWDVVGPRYFSTIGTEIVSGRDFGDRDDGASPPVVAINEAMARLYFGDANAIGRRLIWGGQETAFEIVAVTRDAKHDGAREQPAPKFYLPYLQLPGIRPNWALASTRVLVRTAGDPATLAAAVRERIRRTDARISVASVDVGLELARRTLVRERMVATLLVAFSVLAVGLACLGLYGLIAYQTVQRTSEIGIRMALGAQRSDVLRGILRQGLGWVVAGVALGIPLAVGASRLVRGMLFGLNAGDLGSLMGAAALMSVMGLIAGYIPARRASRVDPIIALRAE